MKEPFCNLNSQFTSFNLLLNLITLSVSISSSLSSTCHLNRGGMWNVMLGNCWYCQRDCMLSWGGEGNMVCFAEVCIFKIIVIPGISLVLAEEGRSSDGVFFQMFHPAWVHVRQVRSLLQSYWSSQRRIFIYLNVLFILLNLKLFEGISCFTDHKSSYFKTFSGGKENLTILKFCLFLPISSGYSNNYFHCNFKQAPSFKWLLSILIT